LAAISASAFRLSGDDGGDAARVARRQLGGDEQVGPV